MKNWSIARRFFAGQLLFVLLLTIGISWALYVRAERQVYEETAARMLAVATTIADDPGVAEAVALPDPGAATVRLQPYADRVMQDASIDFVTIMAPDRTRFTHPNEAEIGRRYIGSVRQALAGAPFTETYTGTLGPSVRAIVPVTDGDGAVAGLVAAGVTVDDLAIARNAQLPAVFTIAGGALAAGALVSWLLSRYLQRVTLGWGPEEMARMFVFYNSVLHSVREGLLLVDPHGRLLLYNDQAADLLGLPRSPEDGPGGAAAGTWARIPPSGFPDSLRELLTSGRRAVDEFHLTPDRVLVVNQEQARSGERTLGTVTTLRDHTEIEALTGELQSLHTLTDALKAQTHEHANRLHTIVSLIELGRSAEALDFATRDLHQSQQLTDEVVAAVDEPFVTALLVGKAAEANERGIRLDISAGGSVEDAALDPAELVTIVGNLLDNAFDAASSSAERRAGIHFHSSAAALHITVTDSGAGLTEFERGRIFGLGVTTKDSSTRSRGIGLALVQQSVTRMGGELVVGTGPGGCFEVIIPLGVRPEALHG